MKVRMPRKRVTVVVATAMALALGGGVAYAYFTAAGSGTGHATVGTSGTWDVTASDFAGTMVPGTGSSTMLFTITNTNADSASQSYDTLGATVAHDGSGNITTGATGGTAGTPVAGCLASWFTPSVGTPSPALGAPVAAGAAGTVTVTVVMPNIATNQDVCKTAVPDITLAVA